MNDQNEIAELIAEQLDRLFAAEVSAERRKHVESGSFDQGLWTQCSELGLADALVPENKGGAGLSWAQADKCFQTLGKHAAPVPLGETMIAGLVLANAGIEIPDGPIATCFDVLTLNHDGTLQGEGRNVQWAPNCGHILVLARKDGVEHLCLVRTDDLAITPVQSLSREPHADIACENLVPAACVATDPEIGTQGLLALFAVLRTSQIAGALGQVLQLSVDYANDRVQFGRHIGSFQAIQQALARLASEAAASQAASAFACGQADKGDAEFGAMVGMTRAGRSAGIGAEIAHQVFGAIGFTDEHTLHYFTRRLWQWRAAAKSEQWWAEKLGERVIAGGGQGLWQLVISG
jgi:acyl-CoA dehydrogenase